MQKLTKTVYETADVLRIVREHHRTNEGNAPVGYHWEARATRAGIIIEPVDGPDPDAKATEGDA